MNAKDRALCISVAIRGNRGSDQVLNIDPVLRRLEVRRPKAPEIFQASRQNQCALDLAISRASAASLMLVVASVAAADIYNPGTPSCVVFEAYPLL